MRLWREPPIKRLGVWYVWVCPECDATGRRLLRRSAVLSGHVHMRTHVRVFRTPGRP